jgi:hypothetical protein
LLMGHLIVKASGVVAAINEAFMETAGGEPERQDILAILKHDKVDREDLVEDVATYQKTKRDAEIRFESVEWDEFKVALREAAPDYV